MWMNNDFEKRRLENRSVLNRIRNTVLGGGIFAIVLFILGIIGYITNIVKIFLMDWNSEITIEFILRIIGIFTGLGAIIGYF